jgi:hypothetical protein
VAEAAETRGEIDSVRADTAVPKARLLDVVNVVPFAVKAPLTMLPGVIAIVTLPTAVAGLVPRAVMLTTPPDAMAVVRVSWTLFVPPPLTAVTTSVVAVPPDGVYVTEKLAGPLLANVRLGLDAVTWITPAVPVKVPHDVPPAVVEPTLLMV